MTTLGNDLRFALRRLARAPGYALTAIALLAFAFAANACVFSEVWCLLYRPLPFAQPKQLVNVDVHWIREKQDNPMSSATLQDLAAKARSFSQIAGWAEDSISLDNGPDSEPTDMEAFIFQPQLFDVLGLKPLAGRAPNADDARMRDPANVLVSPGFAAERFGGVEAALGQTLRTKEGTLRVIGVVPRNAPFAGTTSVWRPLMFSAQDTELYPDVMSHGVRVIGRLVKGATPADAEHELIALQPQLLGMQQFADKGGNRLHVKSMRNLWIHDSRIALEIMSLVVLLIFVIATVNACNLYIARLSLRQHETALLTSLGAGRARLLRLILIETLTLAVASTGIGLMLVPLGFKLLAHYDLLPLDAPYPIAADTTRVWYVGLLALGLTSALTLSALWLQRKHGRIYEMLKQGGARQTAGVAAHRARAGLTVMQVALTTALLVGTGVLVRSAQKLLNEDLGFDREHLAVAAIDFAEDTDAASRQATLLALRERTAALPGVASAALGSFPPFFRERPKLNNYQPPGDTEADEKLWPAANFNFADVGYFATLGQPIIRGRAFTREETRNSAPVAIVDREFVKRHFADGDALGDRFKVYRQWQNDALPASRELTIVGVVGSVKMFAPDQAIERPSIYIPTDGGYSFIVRTRIAPASLEASLIAVVREIAPTARLGAFDSMSERLDDVVHTRFRLNTLLEGLGALALVLAAVGLYAVLSYAVRMRTHEFGVRLALGALPARVRRDVLRQGLRLVAIGLVLGLPLAYVFTLTLASQLYRTAPFDPATLAVVALLVVALGLLASWWPAYCASRVDPTTALRAE
jgi:putative ABC transport system permease protein